MLTYADLQAASPVPGITYADGGNGTVAVSGTLEALGQQFEVTGIAALEAQGSTVTVVPQEISTGNDNLDAAAERLLAGRLVFQAGGLPANVGLTGARGGPDGIVVTASGSNPRCPDHHPVSLSGHRTDHVLDGTYTRPRAPDHRAHETARGRPVSRGRLPVSHALTAPAPRRIPRQLIGALS